MKFIKVPDMNDSMSYISIDGVMYYLRFCYNETGDCWSFGVYDKSRNPIVPMTKIVPNFPLLHYYAGVDGLPSGTFGCLSNKAHIGRKSFVNGDAEFCYITKDEVKDAGVPDYE